ncbi:leupaxin [Brienomyrus brachyistius]|uniref:leupaxin n=1 Tax=Brienomyrus brachyistius TaxID=42636 RepID=UPI0020B4061B|nr:leupaxin [Brienomyrus brachyistius]
MDELDFLLEELAQTTSHDADAVPQANVGVTGTGEATSKPGQITPVYSTKLPARDTSSVHVYSQIPDPVETTLLSPSSATRELDSIMQHLLGLEQGLCDSPTTSAPSPLIPKSGQEGEKKERKEVDEGQAKGGKDSALGTCDNASKEEVKPSKAAASIDDLLGSLASDMEKMGVQTSAKGHCASCGKCIVGKFITALGQVWHPEHFVCLICRVELGTTGYFEREGEAYCQKDYQNLFSPRCGYCKAPILQNILTAMNQSWHPEHFFCAECGTVFGSEGYMEREGKPYCSKDFYRLFAPKCSGCGEPVQENYLSAANGTWHPQCFVCADCLTPFSDGCFMELDGRPLCMLHYHSRQGTLCGGCGAPISGRCIAALDRKFHPEHFVCAFCLRQLAQGVFKEQAGKPYCATCHSKLFL